MTSHKIIRRQSLPFQYLNTERTQSAPSRAIHFNHSGNLSMSVGNAEPHPYIPIYLLRENAKQYFQFFPLLSLIATPLFRSVKSTHGFYILLTCSSNTSLLVVHAIRDSMLNIQFASVECKVKFQILPFWQRKSVFHG